jgi:hypothetical protein
MTTVIIIALAYLLLTFKCNHGVARDGNENLIKIHHHLHAEDPEKLLTTINDNVLTSIDTENEHGGYQTGSNHNCSVFCVVDGDYYYNGN